MVRIITGKYGSRILKTPNNKSVRPTKDRVKESIFNKLFNIVNSYEDKRILDIFAGTGNFGFECLSRGAEHVTFVDIDYRQVKMIENNEEMKKDILLLQEGKFNEARTIKLSDINSGRVQPERILYPLLNSWGR